MSSASCGFGKGGWCLSTRGLNPADPALDTEVVPLCGPRRCLGTTVGSCCFMAQSPKLRVVIMCTAPCSPIPGFTAPAYPPIVNGPPTTPITAGIPFGLSFAGRPGAYADFTKLPSDVVAKFGTVPCAKASSLVFDFGVAGTATGDGFMQGKGVILGKGAAGAAQCSTTFTYTWSRFPACRPVEAGSFSITGCTTKGLAFVVLDDTSFLSADPCKESIVVLLCQQFCPSDNSTPTTVTTCCSCVSPTDTSAGYSTCPTSCAPVPIAPTLYASMCKGSACGRK